MTETDEELVSDNECDLRAKALLDYFKSPAEYLAARSTVLDYALTPPLGGDKIHVELPNENVDSDYRIESVEYILDAKAQMLEVVFELGKVPPMVADYLYGLRTTTVNVEKLARTKLGKRGIPSVAYGGGLGSHHVGHERGSDAGVEWPTSQDGGWDPITGWISPVYVGPYSDSAAIMKFRTQNKAGSVAVDHHLDPSASGYGILGSETAYWKETHALYSLLYGYVRIRVAGDANPKAQLDASMLQFGPGGASALDTWLKRVGVGQLELKADILPVNDNSGNIGSPTKRFGHIYGVNFDLGNLVPQSDGMYDIGENVTPKRWRDLYLSGAIKALGGGVAVHFLPNADGTYNLGASGTRWGNLYISGLGEIGWLNIGGTLVISSGRVLQNVTADAGIITSGKFGLGRLPLGTAGYVLEGEGGADPMYVNPNGRYTPAAHTHSHGSLTGVGPNDHHAQSHNHAGESLSPSSISVNTLSVAVSVNCTNWVKSGDFIFGNDFRITESEKVGLPKGLAFLSPKGKIVMFLDCGGNVEIFGRLSRNRRLKRPKKKRAKA